MEKKEEQGFKEHGESENGVNGTAQMENGEAMVEIEMDFKPIEHPPEPPEEDLPIKCPLPDPFSLIVEEVFEEPGTDSLQTIAQLLGQKEPSSEETTGTNNSEKHQTPIPEHATNDTGSAHKSPHHKIFQVFQQCKEVQV